MPLSALELPRTKTVCLRFAPLCSVASEPHLKPPASCGICSDTAVEGKALYLLLI